MSNTILLPDSGRAQAYNNANVIPMKLLRNDGSVTVPDKSGVEVLPPSSDRAALWQRMAASPAKFLYPDGSVYDAEPGNGGSADVSSLLTSIGNISAVIPNQATSTYTACAYII